MKRLLIPLLRGMLSVGVSLTAITVLLLLLLRACSGYTDTVITTRTREDGAYSVRLLQTSEPAWPFGGVRAAVALYDSEGERLDYVLLVFDNDGSPVSEHNLKAVFWGEDGVTVTVKGYEEDEEVYRIPYS